MPQHLDGDHQQHRRERQLQPSRGQVVRQPGQPFTETLPGFGKVYHTGSTTDVQNMLASGASDRGCESLRPDHFVAVSSNQQDSGL